MEGWLGDRNKSKGTNLTLDDFEITNHVRLNKIPPAVVKKLIKASITAALKKDWCKDLKLIIGGKVNYRKDIWSEYKANRPPKPLKYSKVRAWLEKEYADIIKVAEGCEADDYLGIMMNWMRRQCGGDFEKWDLVLIHRDKDMVQLGGLQWDWFKKTANPIWISEDQRHRSFWVQMLMGDTTDNIPGLEDITDAVWKGHKFKGKRGIGEARSRKLLEDCKDPLDMEAKVLYLYKSYYEQEGEDWQHHFQLNYQLLKLMEEVDEIPIYKFK